MLTNAFFKKNEIYRFNVLRAWGYFASSVSCLISTNWVEVVCVCSEIYTYMYICTKGSATFPRTPVFSAEKHKWIRWDGAFCGGYFGEHLGRFLMRASSLFLNVLTDEAITTSAGRSFHMFPTLWLKVNLRRSSLNRSFLSFRECPRSLEVPDIWKKSSHWTPSQKAMENFAVQYYVSLILAEAGGLLASSLPLLDVC